MQLMNNECILHWSDLSFSIFLKIWLFLLKGNKRGVYQRYQQNVRNKFNVDGRPTICRARGKKILAKMKRKLNSLLHLHISRAIVDTIKDKWYHFKFNPLFLKSFANSLCEIDEIPDEPVFGIVSNITTVAEEMCEIGKDCNEDGSSISEEGIFERIMITSSKVHWFKAFCHSCFVMIFLLSKAMMRRI